MATRTTMTTPMRTLASMATRRMRTAPVCARAASTSHGHDDHHDHGHGNSEPGGPFLGLPKNRKMLFWEPYWYIGMYGTLGIFFFLEYNSPRKGPTAWAREQALDRLEQRGETFGYPLPPNYRSS